MPKEKIDLDGEPSASNTVIDLDLGSLVVKTKKLNRKSSLDINLPVGVAGIRGTEFQMGIPVQWRHAIGCYGIDCLIYSTWRAAHYGNGGQGDWMFQVQVSRLLARSIRWLLKIFLWSMKVPRRQRQTFHWSRFLR